MQTTSGSSFKASIARMGPRACHSAFEGEFVCTCMHVQHRDQRTCPMHAHFSCPSIVVACAQVLLSEGITGAELIMEASPFTVP